MERMVTNRLVWYLETNSILNQTQSGFRAHRSTEDNIAKLHIAIQQALANSRHCLAVFLDFEKAYDMVWRTGILAKLEQHKTNGKLFNYITQFLTDTTIKYKYPIPFQIHTY